MFIVKPFKKVSIFQASYGVDAVQYTQAECCYISDFTKRQWQTSNIHNQENDVLAVNCDMKLQG